MNAKNNQKVETKNVGDLLLEYLRLEKVDMLFGLPGEALSDFLNTLRQNDKEFPFVVARQETGAVYIADGYSRVSGRLGVAAVTSGPGATNAVTAVMNADSMSSSVLLLTGEVQTDNFGRGAFQSGIDGTLKLNDVYRNASGYSSIFTSPANFKTLLEQALRDALSIPRRTVHLSLPENVMGMPIDKDVATPTTSASYRAAPNSANPDDVDAALKALTSAKLPLIYLGNGCRRSFLPCTSATTEEKAVIDARREGFIEMVERFGIPIVTSGDAKGIFPESHELCLRNYGLGNSPWPGAYMAGNGGDLHYDALVVLGSSLNEKNTLGPRPAGDESKTPIGWSQELAPDGPFIQVDANPRIIGRGYDITKGIVAELSAFIHLMLQKSWDYQVDEATCKERLAFVNSITKTVSYPEASLEDRILAVAGEEFAKFAGDDPAQIFVDATTATLRSLRFMSVDPPIQMHNSLAQAPIGFGIGGGVGAKFAAPDQPVLVVSGDGGMLMQGSEISTACDHNLGVVFVAIYNNVLGAVVIEEGREFGNKAEWRLLYELGQPDLVKFAEGLGAYAEAIGPEFKTPKGGTLSPVEQDKVVEQMRLRFPVLLEKAKKEKRPQVLVARVPINNA